GEDRIEELIRTQSVDLVVFAYSDVSHAHVMHKGSQVIAAGADFGLLGFNDTTLRSTKPVVSVCAVRTGAGKSQTTRRVCRKLLDQGRRVVAVRHPMPYGDLVKQRVQRFATFEDLDRHECTIEEREEYEPHLKNGTVVYAGVDYGAILQEAEREADVIVWDGGNNDLPFYKPDVEIVVADPHRPGHELQYHPGEANFRRASGIGTLLPAVGYGEKQMDELKQTIDKVDCDLVLIATPIDLRRAIHFERPALRVTYELQEIGKPDLDDVLAKLP